jgi:hypothetical protein
MRRILAAVLVILGALTRAAARADAAPADRVDALGAAVDHGSPVLAVGHRAVGVVAAPGGGYWIATDDGGVQTFGGAPFHGSAGAVTLAAPVVGMAATPDGRGYWLAGADGGVYAFGTAPFRGSLGGTRLAAPIVGIAAAPDGRGYWLAGADGGVFALGSARYAGGLAGSTIAEPVVGIAASPRGGYWLVAADGGVFTFGGAAFSGSAGDLPLQAPVVAMAATPSGHGYWLVGSDGGVFTFGDAPFRGAATSGAEPIASIAGFGTTGYWVLRSPAAPFPPVPPGSGSGRRIVYSNPMQRVWLIEANGVVFDSHLVSGKYQTPAAGTYSVYSKSRHAYAGHDGIEMDDMVRFARSATSGIPIGFHGIPRRNGVPMQTEEDLGGFRSAGCVRQSAIDAARLYDWTPVGTTVVVLW